MVYSYIEKTYKTAGAQNTGGFIRRCSAVLIVIFGDAVERFAEPMDIDEGAYDDKRAKNRPEPKIRSAEGIGDSSAVELASNSVGNTVKPDQRHNAQRQP